MPDSKERLNIHASCVSFEQKGVLIVGAAGTGKSALTLQLMALGGVLVSDDRTDLCAADHGLVASVPDSIKGLIEARGVGILRADACASVAVTLVVDMDHIETQRLPNPHWASFCDLTFPCFYKIDAPYFPAAIVQYLKGGRKEAQ